jgi:hypothetical protein
MILTALSYLASFCESATADKVIRKDTQHKMIVSPRSRRPSYLASTENANSTFPGALPKLVYPELT